MKLAPKVLILGGHCKVALLLTPLLLSRGCDVISLTNSSVHRGDILDLHKNSKGGNVEVLVTDLKQIDTPDSARALLDRVDPNYVIWMAGKYGQIRNKAVSTHCQIEAPDAGAALRDPSIARS
jgi:hypothetical protein